MPHERSITPLEAVAALSGAAEWSQEEWLAERQQEEENMGRNLAAVLADYRNGYIVGEGALVAMAEQAIADDQAATQAAGRQHARPVRASATADDGEADEFASLYPPKTLEEAERRHQQREQRIAASQAWDDDKLYAALWPESRR